ncbi:MAG: redoxin domain-containing protein [Flavobacteriaceae bacterium]
MKNFLYASLCLALMASCGQGTDGFTIEGELRGEVENDTYVFLKKADAQGRPVDVDTATVENNKFILSGPATTPELHYIFIDQLRGNIPVIVEQGNITITAQKDSLEFTKIRGTTQNELFADFLKTSRGFTQRAMSMTKDMQMASAQQDTTTMMALRDEYKELQDEAKEFEVTYATENPTALISALLLDKILTTGALSEKEVKKLYEALSAEIKDSSAGKKIKEKLDKSESISIGAKAPNFSGPTPTGEQLALNDVLGKATILDFWAAWCRPCRVENPNVVRVYEKYKEKGLSILGVSLDRKAEDWKKAIEDDGLDWNHISNVRYFDEIAALYNVEAIPATFILDENGVIVAKNLRGSALEEKIAEMLQ